MIEESISLKFSILTDLPRYKGTGRQYEKISARSRSIFEKYLNYNAFHLSYIYSVCQNCDMCRVPGIKCDMSLVKQEKYQQFAEEQRCT